MDKRCLACWGWLVLTMSAVTASGLSVSHPLQTTARSDGGCITSQFCNFDNNMCGMTSKTVSGTGQTQWKREQQFNSLRDHSTGTGAFVRLEANNVNGKTSETVDLITLPLCSAGPLCLRFSYSLFYGGLKSLEVWVNESAGVYKLAHMLSTPVYTWSNIQLQVKYLEASARIIFRGISSSATTVVALDDISLSQCTKGTTPKLFHMTPSPSTSKTSPSVAAAITTYSLKPPASPACVANFLCHFTRDMCEMTSSGKWKMTNRLNGVRDHTTGSGLFVQATGPSADLATPTFCGGTVCLAFVYQAWGGSPSLEILGENKVIIYEITSLPPSNGWTFRNITVHLGSMSNIVFRAHPSHNGSTVALDDISVSRQCPLPMSTTPSYHPKKTSTTFKHWTTSRYQRTRTTNFFTRLSTPGYSGTTQAPSSVPWSKGYTKAYTSRPKTASWAKLTTVHVTRYTKHPSSTSTNGRFSGTAKPPFFIQSSTRSSMAPAKKYTPSTKSNLWDKSTSRQRYTKSQLTTSTNNLLVRAILSKLSAFKGNSDQCFQLMTQETNLLKTENKTTTDILHQAVVSTPDLKNKQTNLHNSQNKINNHQLLLTNEQTLFLRTCQNVVQSSGSEALLLQQLPFLDDQMALLESLQQQMMKNNKQSSLLLEEKILLHREPGLFKLNTASLSPAEQLLHEAALLQLQAALLRSDGTLKQNNQQLKQCLMNELNSILDMRRYLINIQTS